MNCFHGSLFILLFLEVSLYSRLKSCSLRAQGPPDFQKIRMTEPCCVRQKVVCPTSSLWSQFSCWFWWLQRSFLFTPVSVAFERTQEPVYGWARSSAGMGMCVSVCFRGQTSAESVAMWLVSGPRGRSWSTAPLAWGRKPG